MTLTVAREQAFQHIGEFLYHFAKLEVALNGALSKVLELNGLRGNIVCANIDISKKIEIVQAAVVEQFAKDRFTNDAIGELKSVFEFNIDRVLVAHGTFEPIDGGIRMTKYKSTSKGFQYKGADWTFEEFQNRSKKMQQLAISLTAITERLSPFKHSLDFSDARNSGYLALFCCDF